MLAESLLHAFCRRFLGPEATEQVFIRAHAMALSSPGRRRAIEANISRVLRHSLRRDPVPAEVAAAAAEMAAVAARTTIAMFSPAEDWPGWLKTTSLDMLPALTAALRGGRGAILATPHFGNHILFVTALACKGLRVNALYVYGTPFKHLEQGNPNVRFLDVGSAAGDCLKALASNELVLVFDDVDYFPDGRTVGFFGAPYHPPHGPARLAAAAGAPILPVYSLMEPGGWRLVCDPAIDPATAGQEEMEAALIRSMETHIGRRPGHWLAYRDAWDLEGNAAELRRQLRTVRFSRGLHRLWKSIRGPSRVP